MTEAPVPATGPTPVPRQPGGPDADRLPDTLVLGGGGVAGIAWMTGLLTGLADAGHDVTAAADRIVGTSAGSVVAAQLGSGLPLKDLYARQTDPALQAPELMVEVDLESFGPRMAELLQGAGATDDRAIRRAIGRLALDTETVPERDRRAVVEARLPKPSWPSHPLLRVVAVDAESGEPRFFDRDSGVPLVDAVAASCAVPGVWPPVTIDGHRYVDGGVRSNDNADLAAGATRTLIVSPFGTTELLPTEFRLAPTVDSLRAAGTHVRVLTPDEASRKAIGTNPLDPATRGPAAEAGRAQGRGAAASLR